MLARSFRAMRTLLTYGVALGAVYAVAIRPRLLHWGTTDEEVERALPGDELVPTPRFQQTHAITIGAPPAQVWPWLVQLGQDRAGLYSYDWLERAMGLGYRNADRIVPEFQRLAVGDEVRLVPKESKIDLRLVVETIMPERALVLRSPEDHEAAFAAGLPVASWAFVLESLDGLATRLVVRFRSDYRMSPAGAFFNGYGLEPVFFLMERRMLLGIRDRAERGLAAIAPDKVEVNGVAPAPEKADTTGPSEATGPDWPRNRPHAA